MEATRPAYLDFLHALQLRGCATRSAVEVERLLAVCRRCNRWDDRGCSRMSAREFALLLADGDATCPKADSGR